MVIYDRDTVEDMIVDWEYGVSKLTMCNRYNLTEHGYKRFNMEMKKRGLVRHRGRQTGFLPALKTIFDRSKSPRSSPPRSPTETDFSPSNHPPPDSPKSKKKRKHKKHK